MNILFLTRRFYPDIGGVETHVLEIGKELIKKNYSVSVITEQDSVKNDSPSVQNIFGINTLRLDFGKDDKLKKFRIWSKLWHLRNYIKSFDIIHCHDVFFWYLPLKIIYPGKKVFVTFHGYEGVFPPKKAAIILRKVSEFFCAGNICVGDYIRKWYGTSPTYVTYGGVRINENQQVSYKKNDEKLKIFLIGRFDKDIGINTYIESLTALRNRNIRYAFKAIGEGQYKNKLKKIGKVVGFIGDIQSEIKKTDIIFASSYLLILQALALKKIVIATYDNQLKEDYLKMSPFANYIYACKDAEEIASVVKDIRDNPWKSRSMTENGFKLARKQTWDEVCKYYLKLWKL